MTVEIKSKKKVNKMRYTYDRYSIFNKREEKMKLIGPQIRKEAQQTFVCTGD
jgi:hypothetical protein